MNRLWIFAILTGTAAWALVRYRASHTVVPVNEAAEKLRKAWADHHTTA